MTIYTIPQKESGSIDYIASARYAREIKFADNCLFAVVLPADHDDEKGYTTHQTEEAAVKRARHLDLNNEQYIIIDETGARYICDYNYDTLIGL